MKTQNSNYINRIMEIDIEQVAFEDIVDLDELKNLLVNFSAITGFTTGLVDNTTNKPLISTGWRDICVNFHRTCPNSEKHCIESNRELTSSMRAADLVQQILTFGRESTHHRHPFMPHLIVKEALKMQRSSLPVTLSFRENIDPDCGSILADPTKIHQIVVNLCTNALHTMENEKCLLSVSSYREEISAEEKKGKEIPTGTEKILVVDDEITIVNLQKTVLERLGYEVTATTDSREALEKIRSDLDHFDLIITDQSMPYLSGVELAEEIFKIVQDQKIILCTGHSSVITEEGALAIGIKKYLRKPINRSTLANVVRQVLDGDY